MSKAYSIRQLRMGGDLYRMTGQLTAERDCLQRSVLKRYGVDVDKDLPDRPGK